MGFWCLFPLQISVRLFSLHPTTRNVFPSSSPGVHGIDLHRIQRSLIETSCLVSRFLTMRQMYVDRVRHSRQLGGILSSYVFKMFHAFKIQYHSAPKIWYIDALTLYSNIQNLASSSEECKFLICQNNETASMMISKEIHNAVSSCEKISHEKKKRVSPVINPTVVR